MSDHGVHAGLTAIVTGAASGIGAATVLALAGQGAAVAIAARRADRLEDLASRISDAGGRGMVIECDVSDHEQAKRAVEWTVEELGRLDTLINNAGVMLLGRIEGADTAKWRQMLDLNVAALMTLAHAALPHLLEAAESEPRRAERPGIAGRRGP